MGKYGVAVLMISLFATGILFPVFADDCGVCNGGGELTCLSCGGSGEVNCPYCYGTSWIPCSKCYGSGLFAGDKCSICDGVGKMKCKRCDETGKVVCAGCGGSGAVTCPECSGSGVTEGYIEITDTGETTDTGEAVDIGETTDTGETVDIGETTDTGETTDIGENIEPPDTEWTADYNSLAGIFDDFVRCELKEFVTGRGYTVATSGITTSAVSGQLNIDFTYLAAEGDLEYEGSAVWGKLFEEDSATGALNRVDIGDIAYKRDGWTFTSYPDYYFWDYEGDWEKTQRRASGWISWKATLASFSDKIPGLIEKHTKNTNIPHKPKKKYINIIEPNPGLYAFEDGDARAVLWRRYMELTGNDRLSIDREGYYIPPGTVYWWHEKAGIFGSINLLYVLGSYVTSGEAIEYGELGYVLTYSESVAKKKTLSFYKPDGYGGLYQVWEEEISIDEIESLFCIKEEQ